jgi:type IV pilus assembly protein PilA
MFATGIDRMERQVMSKKNAGFTLLELMIVIQIISIMAAVALPNMMRLRVQSNQASAIGNLATVVKAQITFSQAERGYAESWAALRDDPIAKGQPAYLDINFTNAVVSGYLYSIGPAGDPIVSISGVPSNENFYAWADPENPGNFGSGIYHYFVDSTGVLRFNKDAQADENSTVL